MKESIPIKNCVINKYFVDSLDPLKEKKKYCKKNCQFKCIKGIEYKKIKLNRGKENEI